MKGLKRPKKSPPNYAIDVHSSIDDPVARLVKELSESLNTVPVKLNEPCTEVAKSFIKIGMNGTTNNETKK